jgi:hypothetical protein
MHLLHDILSQMNAFWTIVRHDLTIKKTQKMKEKLGF